jgi:hypothetical protein
MRLISFVNRSGSVPCPRRTICSFRNRSASARNKPVTFGKGAKGGFGGLAGLFGGEGGGEGFMHPLKGLLGGLGSL